MSEEIMPDTGNEVTTSANDPTTGRRRFLLIGGGALATVALAACGKDDKKASKAKATTTTDGSGTTTTAPETTAGPSTTAGGATDDLTVGAFAASLEVLAVNTYTAALTAAKANKLGAVPPAVATFVQTAQSHHQSALDAWNKVLQGAGKPEVTKPPADLEKKVNDAFGKVTDVTGAGELALMLEQIAAATYLDAIPKLTSKDAIKLAASIQPIDMQHAAILLFVLGRYPVPDTFAQTKMAATPS